MVQLKAEPSGKDSKEDKDEDEEEEEYEDEEDDDEVEDDDLDELVMDDDDEEDEDEDFEDDDDDFEAGDGGVAYGEDDLDDGFFTTDEEGDPLEAVCRARFLKGSPWKFRRVLWQIRGRTYREALMLLEFMPWRACRPTLCALQSAASNAQNQFNMDKSRLYVYSCKADRGPYSKRMRPMSKGQPHAYRRRSTHLEIVVREMSDRKMRKKGEFAWVWHQSSEATTLRKNSWVFFLHAALFFFGVNQPVFWNLTYCTILQPAVELFPICPVGPGCLLGNLAGLLHDHREHLLPEGYGGRATRHGAFYLVFDQKKAKQGSCWFSIWATLLFAIKA